MNVEKIVKQATDDGVFVRISLDGKMKATGEDDAIGRWLPLLRQHKTEITKLLLQGQGATAKATRPLPQFYQGDCLGLESLALPGEGSVWGCLDPHDPNHWRRLDRLTACPARKPRPALSLPEWCSSRCEDFSQTALPNGQIMRKCWRRELGRRSGLLHTTGCPVKGQGKR